VQGGCQPSHTRPNDNNLVGGDLIAQNYGLVIRCTQPGT
jgi:hypothetical protein